MRLEPYAHCDITTDYGADTSTLVRQLREMADVQVVRSFASLKSKVGTKVHCMSRKSDMDCLMKYIRWLTYDCPVLPQRSIDFRPNRAYTVNVVKLLVQLLTSVSKFFARPIVFEEEG